METTEENNTVPATAEEFIYSELQFKNKLIELKSEEYGKTNIKDSILTNFNEPDIAIARGLLGSVSDFDMFGLTSISREVLIPRFFHLVNTARARDGFERNAQIKTIKDERAEITQKGQATGLIERLRSRGK